MYWTLNRAKILLTAFILAASMTLTSCAPLFVAGGAAAGYGAAKDMEDGELIDNNE